MILINLLQDDNNIPLSFSPFFDASPPAVTVVVLNSREGGNWGKEERPDGYDFSSGKESIIYVAT